MNVFGFKVSFHGNPVKGAIKGFCDDMKNYSDSDITEADFNRNMLKECLPAEKWFAKDSLNTALKFVAKKDSRGALKALKKGVISKDADPNVCVWIIQHVFLKIILGSPQILADALPTRFY